MPALGASPGAIKAAEAKPAPPARSLPPATTTAAPAPSQRAAAVSKVLAAPRSPSSNAQSTTALDRLRSTAERNKAFGPKPTSLPRLQPKYLAGEKPKSTGPAAEALKALGVGPGDAKIEGPGYERGYKPRDRKSVV